MTTESLLTFALEHSFISKRKENMSIKTFINRPVTSAMIAVGMVIIGIISLVYRVWEKLMFSVQIIRFAFDSTPIK